MKPASPLSLSAVLALTLVATVACGASYDPPPQTPASASGSPADGGLPIPPASSKKGVIMPGDTGLGASPSGTTTSTGTNGAAVGPTVGGAPGSN
jgi:hypothetical protein